MYKNYTLVVKIRPMLYVNHLILYYINLYTINAELPSTMQNELDVNLIIDSISCKIVTNKPILIF